MNAIEVKRKSNKLYRKGDRDMLDGYTLDA